MHRAEHLHVVNRVEMEVLWQALTEQLYDTVGRVLRLGLVKKVEVFRLTRKNGHLALVDAVCIRDDQAGLRLAEDDVEGDDIYEGRVASCELRVPSLELRIANCEWYGLRGGRQPRAIGRLLTAIF